MTTDVALNHAAAPPALPVITGGNLPGLAVLEQWVTAASHAARLVEPLLASAFVPEAYKPRASANASEGEQQAAYRQALGNATSAVLLGMSLGVDPLTALQNIYIVHGRPGMYSKFKVAIALAAGHEVWVEERTAESVTVAGRRKGWDPERVTRVTVTMQDAKDAGWTSNPQYGKDGASMLQWRASGRVVDIIAPDTLAGIASVEDLDDLPTDRPAALMAPAPRPKAEPGAGSDTLRQLVADTTAEREARAELNVREVTPTHASGGATVTEVEGLPQPVPPVEEPPAPPAEGPSGVTRPQLSQISMLLGGRHGLNGPGSVAKRGRILSALVGRPLTTTQELTADEAGRVIGYLENTDTPALLAMADAPAPAEQEPAGTGSDPWDEPAERDGQEG